MKKTAPEGTRTMQETRANDRNYESFILNSIRESVIVTDLDGIVTYWNSGATRLLGWTADEMLGRPLIERFPPEERRRIGEWMQELAGGVDWEGEFEDYRKDGSRVWIDARIRRILDEEGRPKAILGISHDITDKKFADAAREVAERFRSSVIDAVSAHIAVLDRNGEIRAVNRAWSEFGRANQPVSSFRWRSIGVGANYLEVCRRSAQHFAAEAEEVEQGIRSVIEGRLPHFECEYPCHSPSQKRWFSMTVTPLETPEGGAVVAHIDITTRKLAENSVREHVERLGLALSAARMGVWVFDVSESRIVWSPEVYEILGVGHFDGGKESFRKMVHPDDVGHMEALFDRTIARGGIFSGEFRIVRPDGKIRWVSNFAEVRTDAQGRPLSMIGTVRDVTDEKTAELALIAQNRVLEGIAAGAALPSVLEQIVRLVEERLPGSLCSVLIRDPITATLKFGAGPSLPPSYNKAVDGVPIGPSEGSCGTAAYLGAPVAVAEISTDPLWADYRHIAERFGLRSCVSIPFFDLKGTSADERAPAWIDDTDVGVRPAPCRDADRVLGTFALYRRDETVLDRKSFDFLRDAAHLAGVAIEREQVLQQLRESEERFRLLVDGVRDYAIFLVGGDGKIITWPKGAERTFGYVEKEMIGADFGSLSPKDDSAVADDGLRRAERDGRFETERHQVRKNGAQFWALMIATALRHPDGALRCFAVVVRDLTERRRMEEDLRQSQKLEAVGRLAGGVAHDFNNLLTVINGYTEMLIADTPANDDRLESLRAVKDAGERATSLAGQLLAFSRKAIVEPKMLDLNGAIESTVKMLSRVIGEDIRIATELDPSLEPALVDPGQFEQVVMNLMVNARDAMETGGRIAIATANVAIGEADFDGGLDVPCGRYVEMTVTDTGRGIDDDVKTRIFEPFFTTKSLGKGTGLGLATVYGIVKQAGGHITVASAVGQGSTFRILLPTAEVAAKAERSTTTSVIPRGHETILLVEDEDGVRKLARQALTTQGYVVIEAASGRSAIELVEKRTDRIDLLVTDVIMPDIGGRELVDRLRPKLPGIRVLYMSGYTDDAVVRHGVASAADAFLQKPFSLSSLAKKVRSVLDGHG